MYRRNLTRIEIKLEDIQEFGNQTEMDQQYGEAIASSSAASTSNGTGSGLNGSTNGTPGGSGKSQTITRQARIGLRK